MIEKNRIEILFVIYMIAIFIVSFLAGKQYEHNHIDKKYIIVKIYNPRGYIIIDTFPKEDSMYSYGNNFDSNHSVSIGKNNNFNYGK